MEVKFDFSALQLHPPFLHPYVKLGDDPRIADQVNRLELRKAEQLWHLVIEDGFTADLQQPLGRIFRHWIKTRSVTGAEQNRIHGNGQLYGSSQSTMNIATGEAIRSPLTIQRCKETRVAHNSSYRGNSSRKRSEEH